MIRTLSITTLLGVLAWASTALSQAPAPHAQVQRGGESYAKHCALCHGEDGRGGTAFPRPIWGGGHDLAKFGNARGLIEYLQLQMPFDDPTKVSDEEKLAIAAFMLTRNGTLKGGEPLSKAGAAATALK